MRFRSPRLVLLVGAVVFLDTMFYAVITPLLPQLSHSLHLSKLSAGVMTASYPAGMLIASLPGGALAVRRGPRLTVATGLTLMIGSTVAFGLLDNVIGLDLARFAEGVGGACSWAGGMAWLIAATAPERRGAALGSALGAAIVGALFGPAVGALASAVGRSALFCVLAAIASLLLVPVMSLADERSSSVQPVTDVVRLLGRPDLIGAMWLMLLPAVVSGALNVLGPLQLHHLGAGAGAVGLTFLAGAAIEAVISPAAGRMSDRHDRTLLLRGALVALAAILACFTLPHIAVLLAALVVAIAAMLGVFWAPVMALLADIAEKQGIDQGHAAALMNLAWAAGQIVGSAGSGATAKSFGDAVPTIAVAVLCLLTLVWLRGSRLARPTATPSAVESG
jgi:MFS family permease